MKKRRIKISPTRQGYVFLLILIALLSGSANYNNNLGFILTFLLGSMLIVSIFHSLKNLSALRITSVKVKPVFSSENAVFQLRVRVDSLPRPALHFRFASSETVSHDFTLETEESISISIKSAHRGTLNPGPITVSTYYPLGLIRCHFALPLDCECTVYPEPLQDFHHLVNDRSNLGNSPRIQLNASSDFTGFKAYQPGDSLKHVSWKAFARGQGLLVKEFDGESTSVVMIDWYSVPDFDTEQKLSLLCRMLLEAHRLNLVYGLRIPGQTIQPDRSHRQKHDCLRTLALFGISQDAT